MSSSPNPRSVEVITPDILEKILLVKLPNPRAENIKPLPHPIWNSAPPAEEVIRRKDTLTDPDPVPLDVDKPPDKTAVSFKVSGASIDCEKLIPVTVTDGNPDDLQMNFISNNSEIRIFKDQIVSTEFIVN